MVSIKFSFLKLARCLTMGMRALSCHPSEASMSLSEILYAGDTIVFRRLFSPGATSVPYGEWNCPQMKHKTLGRPALRSLVACYTFEKSVFPPSWLHHSLVSAVLRSPPRTEHVDSTMRPTTTILSHVYSIYLAQT